MTLSVFMYSKKKVLWFGLRCVRKPTFYIHAKTKAQIICVMTAHLISALVSLHQALYFLIREFQASSHLLWLLSPVMSDGNPEDGFSCDRG